MRQLLIHCSYHKCLTVFFKRVVVSTLKLTFKKYHHFNSFEKEFYNNINKHYISSINNHYLNFEKISTKYKITRFIRDPRDLVVSGYFYHKRGAEKWCNIKNPKPIDWEVVNGNIPEELKKFDGSYSEYLNAVSLEEGLKAEIDFRKHHFESMLLWPQNAPNIKVYKYEDIIGNEGKIFNDIFKFYELNPILRQIAKYYANKYAAPKRISKESHIRNPSPKQWINIFSKKTNDYFNSNYLNLLKKENYLK